MAAQGALATQVGWGLERDLSAVWSGIELGEARYGSPTVKRSNSGKAFGSAEGSGLCSQSLRTKARAVALALR